MGKFTKKLKKFVKKAAPLAMLGLGAAALAKRRKPTAGFLKSEAAGGASLAGHVGNQRALAKRLLTSPEAYNIAGQMPKTPYSGAWSPVYKKGGRVTGIAKRGFGRALKKK